MTNAEIAKELQAINVLLKLVEDRIVRGFRAPENLVPDLEEVSRRIVSLAQQFELPLELKKQRKEER